MHFRFCVSTIILAMLPSIVLAQAANRPLPTAELRTLADVFGLLHSSYVKPLSGEELVLASIRGMVREVDPDGGEFVTKEEMAKMEQVPGVSDGSIGLEMTRRDNQIVVVSPIVGSPAEKAGVHPGDIIDVIDGVSVRGELKRAVQLLRGAIGSSATVSLHAPGDSGREMRIVRQKLQAPFVRVSMATADVAVLKVTSFMSDTLASVASQLTQQWRKHPFKALVLDLRRNAGGHLNIAVGLSSLFLAPQSLVAQTEGRMSGVNVTYLAEPKSYGRSSDVFSDVPQEIRQLPLVVLVDEGTSAGAELVVAALRDHKRARIVGRKTFGNTGIRAVQSINQSGVLTFTVANWYPPSHEQIDKIGITPDRVILAVDPQQEMDGALTEVRAALH
ncbi:S41 family peptidase [Ralstonia solanacearum species complex bacterium KE056]|uniref:S41 family peptidase n=1 Tax=Ralstonia solanacearum species complex bacterium KE056 TaxID=3119585 RepID=UPI002FC2E7B7